MKWFNPHGVPQKHRERARLHETFAYFLQKKQGRSTQRYQRERQRYKEWLAAHVEATILNVTYYQYY